MQTVPTQNELEDHRAGKTAGLQTYHNESHRELVPKQQNSGNQNSQSGFTNAKNALNKFRRHVPTQSVDQTANMLGISSSMV